MTWWVPIDESEDEDAADWLQKLSSEDCLANSGNLNGDTYAGRKSIAFEATEAIVRGRRNYGNLIDLVNQSLYREKMDTISVHMSVRGQMPMKIKVKEGNTLPVRSLEWLNIHTIAMLEKKQKEAPMFN